MVGLCRELLLPETIVGTLLEHMDYRTWLASSLEERVVAAEVASRRVDGPGVI
eukprot:SAG11_NODE_23230_length_392_cov_2.682594_1_plen_52_part_10